MCHQWSQTEVECNKYIIFNFHYSSIIYHYHQIHFLLSPIIQISLITNVHSQLSIPSITNHESTFFCILYSTIHQFKYHHSTTCPFFYHRHIIISLSNHSHIHLFHNKRPSSLFNPHVFLITHLSHYHPPTII